MEYAGGKTFWTSYQDYVADLHTVWTQCARVLRPNGKLCINAPVMPIPKAAIRQHTRHLKNIAFDIEHTLLNDTDLERYALFVWQKQTSKMMFGSYPYPGNIIENNTIEFINVYVKPGKPPKFERGVKAANLLGRAEWLDLTQQVWFMYPEDVKRGGNHPAPFPQKLPEPADRFYSYGAAPNFAGEIVLDPFVGTGTTCAVAKSMGRHSSASTSAIRISPSRGKRCAPRRRLNPCCAWAGQISHQIRVGGHAAKRGRLRRQSGGPEAISRKLNLF